MTKKLTDEERAAKVATREAAKAAVAGGELSNEEKLVESLASTHEAGGHEDNAQAGCIACYPEPRGTTIGVPPADADAAGQPPDEEPEEKYSPPKSAREVAEEAAKARAVDRRFDHTDLDEFPKVPAERSEIDPAQTYRIHSRNKDFGAESFGQSFNNGACVIEGEDDEDAYDDQLNLLCHFLNANEGLPAEMTVEDANGGVRKVPMPLTYRIEAYDRETRNRERRERRDARKVGRLAKA